MSAYHLYLTKEDVKTIAFVGDRYAWSDALFPFDPGDNFLTEGEAWELLAAFEEDTLGGHSPFPLLDPNSNLYQKLLTFWDSII